MKDEILQIRLDTETKGKLRDLSKNGDMSKVIRALILREWDAMNDSLRVPVVGSLSKNTKPEDIK